MAEIDGEVGAPSASLDTTQRSVEPAAEPPSAVRVIAEMDTTQISPAPEVRRPELEKRDIDEKRESMRGIIALILVCLLVVMVILAFVAVFQCTDVKNVKELLTVLFPPVIAIVGSVTGFYYGGKTDAGR